MKWMQDEADLRRVVDRSGRLVCVAFNERLAAKIVADHLEFGGGLMEQQSKFSGWALIELFGHGHEAGFVTTQYFGDKAMFQVDVPEIPSHEETLQAPKWGSDRLLPAGTVISRAAVPGRTRLINPGAVYSMNPATEEAVRAAVARGEAREMKVISIPEGSQPALAASVSKDEYVDEDDEGL